MDSIFEKIIVFGTHTEREDGAFLNYLKMNTDLKKIKLLQLKGIKSCYENKILYSI